MMERRTLGEQYKRPTHAEHGKLPTHDFNVGLVSSALDGASHAQVITEIKKKKGIKLDLEMEAGDWKEVRRCRAALVGYRDSYDDALVYAEWWFK